MRSFHRIAIGKIVANASLSKASYVLLLAAGKQELSSPVLEHADEYLIHVCLYAGSILSILVKHFILL